jgi:urease accessory protein UreH
MSKDLFDNITEIIYHLHIILGANAKLDYCCNVIIVFKKNNLFHSRQKNISFEMAVTFFKATTMGVFRF